MWEEVGGIKMIRAYSRGHSIVFTNDQWVNEDNLELIGEEERPCAKCNCMPTKEGYDACIGKIDNATSACCGHGVEEPYVILDKEEK